MIPGEYFFDGPDIELNAGRPVVTSPSTIRGDRPVQIGAHYHFFEVNKALVFDRVKAYGMRLDLPSGTSVRFEPGDTKEVKLIPYGGRRVVYGFNAAGQRPPGRPLYPRDQPEALYRRRIRPQAIQVTRRRRPIPSRTELGHRTHERETLATGLRQEIWPDEGRPHPAGRFRAGDRDRGALRRLRRGVDLRRRQIDPRRAGPVPARGADESASTATW